jgi:hypothetical protein
MAQPLENYSYEWLDPLVWQDSRNFISVRAHSAFRIGRITKKHYFSIATNCKYSDAVNPMTARAIKWDIFP